MHPLTLARIGIIDAADAVPMMAQRDLAYWPERHVRNKRRVHFRAANMGINDPTKPDYSRYAYAQRVAEGRSKELSHGCYYFYSIPLRRAQIAAAVGLQRIFRGWSYRMNEQKRVIHSDIENMRRAALDRARRHSEREITKLDSREGTEKIKWDAAIRLRQSKMMYSDIKITRAQLILLIMEERYQEYAAKINAKYNKKSRKRMRKLNSLKLKELAEFKATEDDEAARLLQRIASEKAARAAARAARAAALEAKKLAATPALLKSKPKPKPKDDGTPRTDGSGSKGGSKSESKSPRSAMRPSSAGSGRESGGGGGGGGSVSQESPDRQTARSGGVTQRSGAGGSQRDDSEWDDTGGGSQTSRSKSAARGATRDRSPSKGAIQDDIASVSSGMTDVNVEVSSVLSEPPPPPVEDMSLVPMSYVRGTIYENQFLDDENPEEEVESVRTADEIEEVRARRRLLLVVRVRASCCVYGWGCMRALACVTRLSVVQGLLMEQLAMEDEANFEARMAEIIVPDVDTETHFLEIFEQFDDDGEVGEWQDGAAVVPGELWQDPTGGDNEPLVPPSASPDEIAAFQVKHRVWGGRVPLLEEPFMAAVVPGNVRLSGEDKALAVRNAPITVYNGVTEEEIKKISRPDDTLTPAQMLQKILQSAPVDSKEDEVRPDAAAVMAIEQKAAGVTGSGRLGAASVVGGAAGASVGGSGRIAASPMPGVAAAGAPVAGPEGAAPVVGASAEAAAPTAIIGTSDAGVEAADAAAAAAADPAAAADAAPAIESKEAELAAAAAQVTAVLDEAMLQAQRDGVATQNERARGYIVGERQVVKEARLYSVLCTIPLPVLRRRLLQMCYGITERHVDDILRVFPSKRLLMRYVGRFPSREHLAEHLKTCFHVPAWHAGLFAARLIRMRRSDLESGIIERTASVLQWRHEAQLLPLVTPEFVSAVVVKHSSYADRASGEKGASAAGPTEVFRRRQLEEREWQQLDKNETEALISLRTAAQEKLLQARHEVCCWRVWCAACIKALCVCVRDSLKPRC